MAHPQVGMVPLSDLCAVVPDLREGHLYEFRVVAVNKAGRGEWSDTSDVVEKKVKSWFTFRVYYNTKRFLQFNKFIFFELDHTGCLWEHVLEQVEGLNGFVEAVHLLLIQLFYSLHLSSIFQFVYLQVVMWAR